LSAAFHQTEGCPQALDCCRDPDFIYPGGESFRQMQHRSTAFVSSLAESLIGKTILIVVHAGVIRGLVSYYLGLEYATQLKRKISHRYIGEFLFDGKTCVRYDELGKPSGFARGPERVRLPWCRAVATDRRTARHTVALPTRFRPDP
jgi:broad specificity phosphatase PhoE